VRRTLPFVAALLLVALLGVTGILESPGAEIRSAAGGYVLAASSGASEEACALLTDSLSELIAPQAFGLLPAPPQASSTDLGREEPRGFSASIELSDGSTRTVWLRREGGSWRISGDSWLDGVLGAAGMLCREYGLSVLAGIAGGEAASDFSCPVTGAPYSVDAARGVLICPAGHLGDGLAIGGDACAARRSEVAREVSLFVSQGHDLPLSPGDMWSESGGAIGQPGGYRCPDNGYSYYEIRDSSVWCPFHAAGTPVPGREPSDGDGEAAQP
jgi:hypothetical protein